MIYRLAEFELEASELRRCGRPWLVRHQSEHWELQWDRLNS